MKRRILATTMAAAALALAAAGVGSGSTYDPSTRSGFITRGEIIAAGGKTALIADPVVRDLTTTTFNMTCRWPDSTERTVARSRSLYVLYRAEARDAGNGTITGYRLGSDLIFDGNAEPPGNDTAICWSLLGRSDDGTPVDISYDSVSTRETLTFFGPNGAFDLKF